MDGFTPAQVEEITGLPPVTLRQWRFKAGMENVGVKTEGAHWRYRRGDLAVLASVAPIMGAGVDLGNAILIAQGIRQSVCAWLRPESTDLLSERDPKFIAIWREDNARLPFGPEYIEPLKSGDFRFLRLADLNRATLYATRFFVIDLEAFANTLPDAIKAEFAKGRDQ